MPRYGGPWTATVDKPIGIRRGHGRPLDTSSRPSYHSGGLPPPIASMYAFEYSVRHLEVHQTSFRSYSIAAEV